MKILFVVACALIALVVEDASAQVCGSLFSNLQNQNFSAVYFKNAMEISRSEFEPADLQSRDVLAKEKFEFVKKHSSSLEKILAEGNVSLADIVKAKLFTAESLSTSTAKPHSHVMALGSKIYSFDFEGKSYRVLNETQVGFLAKPTQEVLRLDDQILRIQNDQVKLYDGTMKDPMLLSILAKSKEFPKDLLSIYNTYRTEINDMLLNSALTIPEFLETTPIVARTERNETVVIIASRNNHYYLASKSGIINDSAKKWGELSLSPEFGYSTSKAVRLQTEAKQEFVIEDNRLKLSNDVRSMNLLLSLLSIVKNSETSRYRADFIRKYSEVITEHIGKNSFKEDDFYSVLSKLDVVVSTAQHVFYMLPSKNGEMYFDTKAVQWGYIKDLPTAQYGKAFYTSKGTVLQISQSVGFNSQRLVRTSLSENRAINQEAFLAKASLALGGAKLSEKQSTMLLGVLEHLSRNGFYAEDNVIHPAQASEAARNIKISLEQDALFKPEQVDEILKVLF